MLHCAPPIIPSALGGLDTRSEVTPSRQATGAVRRVGAESKLTSEPVKNVFEERSSPSPSLRSALLIGLSNAQIKRARTTAPRIINTECRVVSSRLEPAQTETRAGKEVVPRDGG